MNSKKISAFAPLFFTILGAGLVGSLAIYRLLSLQSFMEKTIGFIAILIYVSWVLLELKVSVGELDKDESKDDHMTMEICAVVKIYLLSSALAFSDRILINVSVIGMVVMILGISIRTLAIRKLGKNYSHRIREVGFSVVKDGLYGVVRHPAYLGTALAHTGVVLIFLNRYSVIGLALWYAAVVMRTKVEENRLLKMPEYKSYTDLVKTRLLPGIW